MSPHERRAKRDSIITHLAQRLSWEVRNVSARDAFDQSVEVARLAIELARLKGSKEPEQHVDDAARLLTGARRALADEQKRPEREWKEMEGRMWEEYEAGPEGADAINPKIPFAQVVTEKNEAANLPTLALDVEALRDGEVTEGEPRIVKFERYKTVDGFRKLLRRHAARICTEAAKRLREVLCCAKPDVERAQGILEVHSRTKEEMARCAAVRTAKEGERFVVRWEKDAARRLAEYLMERAKAGMLRAVDYLDLMKTRELGNQRKTEAARKGRAKRRR